MAEEQGGKEKKTPQRSRKRDLIEWALVLGIPAFLFVTGLHTEVIGRLQQVILWTNIIQPNYALPNDQQPLADYQFDLATLDGAVTSMNGLKGKVVFINFWATWCAPCVAEMPNIQKLYDKVASDDIVFLMINLDDQREEVDAFLARKEFSFPIYQPASRIPDVFRSSTIPSTFVVAPNGRVVSQRHGMANYDSAGFRHFLQSLVTTSG